MNKLSGTALGDYGAEVFQRDFFTCVYCGFDGRLFDSWMQLSVDHIRPQQAGGDNSLENLATACKACNSITSRMKFAPESNLKQIVKDKRERVGQRRKVFYDWWLDNVAPGYLDRPLPPIDNNSRD